jgi:hypothetical protein
LGGKALTSMEAWIQSEQIEMSISGNLQKIEVQPIVEPFSFSLSENIRSTLTAARKSGTD